MMSFDSQAQRFAEALRQVPIFTAMTDELVQLLAGHCKVRDEEANVRIIREGDPSLYLYVILSGSVRVERRGEKATVVLALRGKGEAVGEMSLLDGLPASATVVTTEDTELLLLPRTEFLHCVRRSSSLATELIRVLASRLREANDARVILQTGDVCARVAQELLAMISRLGLEGEQPVLRLDMSQADIGNKIGASRESVNKILQRLQQGSHPALWPFGTHSRTYRVDVRRLSQLAIS